MQKLIVPVYLNQNIVFDLLAMLQGGISTVTSVNESNSTSDSNSQNASALFGLNSAFSTLLKIDLSAQKAKKSDSATEKAISEERIHTPASLFYQLRNILIEQKILLNSSFTTLPKSGDFIEFEATLNKNPFIETLDTLSQLVNLALSFDEPANNISKNKSKNQSPNELQKIKKQIDDLNASFKTTNTTDLTAKNVDSNYQAVITLDTQYLSDKTMSNLADGKFCVLAKVIRTIHDESESISLVRNASVSKMPKNVFDNFIDFLNNLSDTQGFETPKIVFEIKGPAIQVIPVAIYA